MHISDLLTLVPILGLTGGFRGVRVGGQVLGGKMSPKQLRQIAGLRATVAAGGSDAGQAQQRLDRLYEAADNRRRAADTPASPTPATSMFNTKLNKGDVVGAIDQSIMSADKALDLGSQTRSRLRFNTKRTKAMVDDALDKYPLL